ncbi:MAG TPA: ELM1/GtrOC1 family putative glycosyltransferase, partial [Alphaproteobacteria bacterium]|nr:ELM1/GtrOC1 family putative glycosyltransferase [Alphaproteobacteria bacterium]
GKPVHVIELRGGNKRFRRFLEGLYQDGFARRFEGAPLPEWSYLPPDDTATVADVVRTMLASR